MFKATAVLSVALASGKNKYTFSQDTADLSLSVLRLLCWQSCRICILTQFGGRRKILGCLPELEELHRADFSASLGSPAKAGTDTPCLWCLHWEGGQPFWLACLGDAQRVKVEDLPPAPLQEGEFSSWSVGWKHIQICGVVWPAGESVWVVVFIVRPVLSS